MAAPVATSLALDGEHLIEDVVAVARGHRPVHVAEEALAHVRADRAVVEAVLARGTGPAARTPA